MLHDILDDDHTQWHPPLIRHYINFWPLLIWSLLPNLTFYLILQGFHRTYATAAACQQRTLTPLDTWSCPTLGLACVLMSRPISPELVLSPDFLISNIPRYFSFALNCRLYTSNCRLYSLKCIVDTSNCIINTLMSKCGLYSLKCIIYRLKFIIDGLKCIIRSLKCIIDSLKCRLYTSNCIIDKLKCIIDSFKYIIDSLKCIINSSKCRKNMYVALIRFRSIWHVGHVHV